MTLILTLALILEWFVGDPQSRWHPVALFGRWAACCESRLYASACSRGVVAWLCVIAVPFALIWAGRHLFGLPFDVLLLWASIGWKSLFEHVQDILDADMAGPAREAASRIVSRDTGPMGIEDARRAALESLAENASDAVVAPLFWFVLLGPLGAAFYRMVNTLDAMWGYRNARYLAFGRCAARADDAVNWLPARITACLLLWCGNSADWAEVRRQARTHASPNAGWPEAALAYAAGVQLGGPVMREGREDKRPFYGSGEAGHIDAIAAYDTKRIVRNSLILATLLAFGATLVI